MKEKTSQLLFTYWNEVRGDRVAPRRFEIEPSRIAPVLPETFILEREQRSDYRFRLAGTRVCEQFGREFRGSNLLEMFAESDRETITRLLETVCHEGAVGVLGFRGTDAGNRSVDFEMVLLGLVHTGEAISRVLGAITALQPPGWLGSTPITVLSVTTTSMIWPDGRPHAVIEKFDRRAPFMRHTQQPATVHRLNRRTFRVYEGGLTHEGRPGPAGPDSAGSGKSG